MIREAQTEREILEILDHPFLSYVICPLCVSEEALCLVMEYCRWRFACPAAKSNSGRSFCEQAAENILVREDGHIMLRDFDLSLRCAVNPTLLKSSSPVLESTKKMSSPCIESSCIDPFCLQPSCKVSCFTPRLLSAAAKSRKIKSELAAQVSPLPQLVVEPTSASPTPLLEPARLPCSRDHQRRKVMGVLVINWTFGIYFLFRQIYMVGLPSRGSGNERHIGQHYY
ncbi:hypothetical protein GBA52_027204 [Prunus armeniaca]|nr:hypothetical protein GBA52_027204 [Prunus armeniaca]